MESSETQGIDLLFKKLGHEIVEIRTRALESIVSKLKHGLIHEADIVQERQLLVRLLEWFNFNPSPKQDVVLQLLARLTKHSTACDLLVSLGAVTFFSKLRTDIDGSLKPQIDVVVNRLLHVRDKDIVEASQKHCVYGSKNQPSGEPHLKQEVVSTNYGYFTPSSNEKNNETSSTVTPPTPLVSGAEADYVRSKQPDCLRFFGFPWHSLTGTDRHVLMSTGSSLCSPNPHSVRTACAFLLDVIFRDFPPEIFLQRPAIVQTLLTLISSRPGGQLMAAGLACLQALAEGLNLRLHFFQDPTFYCPRQGLPFHCGSLSRSRLSDLESFSESDLASRSEAEGARRFERSVGDGRDERSSSSATASNSIRTTPLSQTRQRYRRDFNSFTWDSSQGNDDSENDLASLQRSTITTPQFCLSSLVAALPSLKTESSRLALNLLQTIIPFIKLLNTSLRSHTLWSDKSVLAQNLQTQVRQLLEIAGDTLLYHFHLDDMLPEAKDSSSTRWIAKSWSCHELKMHRLIFQTLASFLLELLQTVLPLEQAFKEVKGRLGQALFVIACDQPLALCSPNESDVAAGYLEQCSRDKYEIVCRARKISTSFQHTHMFLKDYKDVNESDVTLEIMEFAESSIEGLPYHSDTRHLKAVIRAVSKVFFNAPLPNRDSTPLQCLSKRILLRLLAHPLVLIRRATYDECLRLLRAGINVDAAAESLGHTASYIARFLLHPDVLYEICCHGLGDSSRLVCHPAQEIITLLLQGRLLIADEVWNEFCSVFQPVLPVLQAYTAETELLQSALNIYTSPNEHPDQDWDIEFFKSCLRSLLLKNRTSRSSAAARLTKMVEEKENIPRITGLTDLLMVDTPLSLVPRDETDCFRIRRCVFQEDAVLRMLSVFRSTSTEESIRVGALRQLATMLDDPGLHEAFLNDSGLESVCEKLLELARNDTTVLTDDVKPALSSCIMIIKLVIRRDSVARERMSRDFQLISALVKAADLCRLSVASLTEISVVIALLVFHDVIKIYVRVKDDETTNDAVKPDVTELSLPAAVLTRYQIPFLCPSHHTVSVHRTLVSLPSPSCDPIFTAPPAFLRISWNVAMYDSDVVALCSDSRLQKNKGLIASDELDLNLTEDDLLFLNLSHPTVLSSSLLNEIIDSTSHSSARHAFSLMKIAILSSRDHMSLIKAMLCGRLNEWKEVLGKFLRVAPSCYEDEILLTNLTSLLDEMFKQIEKNGVDWSDATIKNFLLWFLDDCVLVSDKTTQVLGHGSPLLRILESSEPQPEPATPSNDAPVSSVSVRRQLCKGILSLLSRTARLLQSYQDNSISSLFHRELRTVILLRLRLAVAPQFYDVPSMEITLDCLVHVSACKMKFRSNVKLISEATDQALLQQLIGTLLEIISAFHIRSGTSNMSYMGKGVSRCATQCLLHLVREISVLEYTGWTDLLHYTPPTQTTDPSSNFERLGLEWLVPLWSSRDPQMRFSGLAVSSIIGRTRQGAISLAHSFSNYTGGIWNMTLCVALDHSECSAVRSQAFNLLSNLVTHKFDASEMGSSTWQGPAVQEEGSETTLTGLPALLVLLHHAHMYEHIALIMTCFHPHPTVLSPSQPAADYHLANYPGTDAPSMLDSASPTIATNMSVLTQTSIPNQSPAFSSSKGPAASAKLAAGDAPDHQKTPSYPPSPMNSLPDGWRSLTTPSLVSSVCRFLNNLMALAPHDTLHSLMVSGTLHSISSLLDSKNIQKIIEKLLRASNKTGLKESVDRSKQLRRSVYLRHLLDMHGTVARLLSLVVCAEKSLAPRILNPDESFVKNVVSFLSVKTTDDSWLKPINETRQCVLGFLCAILHQNMKEPLSSTVLREWKFICDCVLTILNDQKNSVLHTIAMKTLALLFKSENIEKNAKNDRREINLTWLLEKSKGSSSDASDLIDSLVRVFESQIVNPSSAIPGTSNDKLVACCHALQNLFACSYTAQRCALKVGFLERVLAETRDQHTRMSLQFTTIQANKARSSSDSKSSLSDNYESYLRIINLLLSILNNLLHRFIEGKEAAASSNLALLLSLLWSWSSHFSSLLIPLLRLTVTYTAHCVKAAASITASPSSSQPSVATALVRLCRDVHSMVLSRTKCPTPVLQLSFNALINSASAPECRALLWKTNLLELFPATADRGQHPKRSKQQALLLDCWLRLLLALSFHNDGQLNLLKIRDFLDILLELHTSARYHQPLLILRNLCFHSPSKNRLSSNSNLVCALMNELYNDDKQAANFSSTAILALLCNNQKAKVHLKGAGLTQNLQNALARLTLSSSKEIPCSESPYKKSLDTMLEIMRS